MKLTITFNPKAALLCLTTMLMPLGQRAWAQVSAKRAVDSLLLVLHQTSTNAEREELFKTLSFTYRLVDPRLGIAYADKAITGALKNKREPFAMESYLAKGLNQIETGNVPAALASFESSLKLATALRNNMGIAHAKGGIGQVYAIQGKTAPALKYLLEALNGIDDDSAHRSIGNLSNVTGILYHQLGQYPKALQYQLKALQHFENIKDTVAIAEAQCNLGATYQFGLGDNGRAMTYYHNALTRYEKQQYPKGIATMNMNIGTVFYNQGKIAQAKMHYLTADSIRTAGYPMSALPDLYNLTYLYNNLGVIYTEERDFGKAKRYLHEAALMAVQSKNPANAALVAHSTGEMHWKAAQAANGRQEALLLGKAAHQIESAADFYLKAGNLQFYPLAQKQLSDIYLSQNRFPEAIAALNRHIQYKDSLFNREREREFARLEIQSVFDRKQDSLKLEQVKKDVAADFRLRQQWLYSGMALLLLAGTGGVFFYRSRLVQSKLKEQLSLKKAEQEEATAQFQANMSAAALSSLRSQMNPHFIFNCLNSIKLYASKNDGQAATDYLSKFSRLMRLVLENSKSELITLVKEEETLRLYLEMEKMRLKERLEYTLTIPDDIDREYTELPPMLIQPYVENAIWHGLMPRPEGGRIDIIFAETGNLLIVTIRDNGIGRKKALAMKNASTMQSYQSFGSRITDERLHLLNSDDGNDTPVTIRDLNENGQATGTEVTIRIPTI